VRNSRAQVQGDEAVKDERLGGRISDSHPSLPDGSSKSDTDIGTLLIIGQADVTKSYFLQRIGYGNQNSAIRTAGSASEASVCRLGDKKFRHASCIFSVKTGIHGTSVSSSSCG
jgi:hypothetical protein